MSEVVSGENKRQDQWAVELESTICHVKIVLLSAHNEMSSKKKKE
jgi:hypothetical protein